MAKIQINENELKQIVAESVNKALSEGQGWHYFKQNLPGALSHNTTLGDVRDITADDWREFMRDTKNYIKHGDMYYDPNDPNDKPGDYYRTDIVTGPESGFKKEDVIGSKDEKKYRRTKRGLGAQIGRAAGVGAVAAAGVGKMGYNTIRNAFKNKNMNNNKINENNMAKVQINENELKQIVAESVKKVLNELDWRTYANAALKASGEAFDKNLSSAERLRRRRQSDKFFKASDDKIKSDYGLPFTSFDDDNINKLNNGQLKQADKLMKDRSDYYNGKAYYKDGRWVNRN